MRYWLIITAIIGMCFLSYSVDADAIEYEEKIIVGNSDYGMDEIKTNDGKIVWTASDGNDYEIYYWDGETVSQLTDNDVHDQSPCFNGSDVVWIQNANVGSGDNTSGYSIVVWDGESLANIPMESDDGIISLSCDNGLCAWSQFADATVNTLVKDLWSYDGETSENLTNYVPENRINSAYDIIVTEGKIYYRLGNSPNGGIYLWEDGSSTLLIADDNLYDFEDAVGDGILYTLKSSFIMEMYYYSEGTANRLTTNDKYEFHGNIVSEGDYFWVELNEEIGDLLRYNGEKEYLTENHHVSNVDYSDGVLAYLTNDRHSLKALIETPPSPTKPESNPGGDRIVYDEVQLDGSGSTSANGDIVSWEWKIKNRNLHETHSTHQGESVTLSSLPLGIYDVTLTVTDDIGLADSKSFMLIALGPYDVSRDGKQGLEEAIHIMRNLVNKKQPILIPMNP